MDPESVYAKALYDADHDFGSMTSAARFDEMKRHVERMLNRDKTAEAERVTTYQQQAADNRRAMLRFIRIAMNLFKRTPHADACAAKDHLTAECTCGLADVERELASATASVVLTSMGGK